MADEGHLGATCRGLGGDLTGARQRRSAAFRHNLGEFAIGENCGYRGLARVHVIAGSHLFASAEPLPGSRTVPIEKGYLANAWFRLRHPDYARLLALMEEIGRTLRVYAHAG